jgi:hypothetical protein
MDKGLLHYDIKDIIITLLLRLDWIVKKEVYPKKDWLHHCRRIIKKDSQSK